MNKKIEKVVGKLRESDGLMIYRKKVICDVVMVYIAMSALMLPVMNGFLYGISPVLALVTVLLVCALGLYGICKFVFLGLVTKELTGRFMI